MNKYEFCEVLGDINENHVKEAREYRKAKKPGWIKWGTMAACLCLAVAVISVPYILASIQDAENIAEGNATTDVTTTKMIFEAKVLEIQEHALIVEPLAGTPERELTESIFIDTEDLAELSTVEYVKRAQVGDTIEICYLKENSDISNGEIAVYKIIPLEESK